MGASHDNVSMALFCDFENVALGVRDANYEQFDIKPVLERLLLKGSITVKKAYCDWDRYKAFKKPMHEANFELIEIPHVRQSGKNSADIRLVVDALDLCYTKAHVNTFVIISGDSDFSPLVSKLRENDKQVIGVGVKQSTSDLLIANCDEFIFYDDLVREKQRAAAKRASRDTPAAPRNSDDDARRKEEIENRRRKAIDLAVETFDALVAERGDSGKIWASVLKDAIKRRKPDFNESYFGFRAFGNLLEEARARGLLDFGRDEKSNTFVYRMTGNGADAEARPAAAEPAAEGGRGRTARGRNERRPSRQSPASDEAGMREQAADTVPVAEDAAAPVTTTVVDTNESAASAAAVQLERDGTPRRGRGNRPARQVAADRKAKARQDNGLDEAAQVALAPAADGTPSAEAASLVADRADPEAGTRHEERTGDRNGQRKNKRTDRRADKQTDRQVEAVQPPSVQIETRVDTQAEERVDPQADVPTQSSDVADAPRGRASTRRRRGERTAQPADVPAVEAAAPAQAPGLVEPAAPPPPGVNTDVDTPAAAPRKAARKRSSKTTGKATSKTPDGQAESKPATSRPRRAAKTARNPQE